MSWYRRKRCAGYDEKREGGLCSLTGKERLKIAGMISVIGILLAATFFQSVWGLIVVIPVGYRYGKFLEKKQTDRKKHQLEIQFKDALQALTSSLQAGYSLEKGIEDACQICATIYGKESMICRLFGKLLWGQQLNVPMLQLLEELEKESQLEVVTSFTEVVKATRKYGGNLPDMLQQLTGVIEDRLTVKSEILTVTASVRYEAYIMDAVPIAIIWYMNVSSPSFLQILYLGIAGRCFMMVCMAVYCVTVIWQFQIMERALE